MPAKTVDPFKRTKSRYPGVTYRLKADGSRTYSVRHGGKQHPVTGGEREALDLQADLRKRPKGIVAASVMRFKALAEQWFTSKHKLPTSTRTGYRDALDRIVMPRFGTHRLTAITTQEIAALIRELESQGLSSSTINNYLVPLSGTLAMAVSRGLIPTNPYSLLTKDERPTKKIMRKQDHVWSDAEITALLESSAYLAKQPASRYDYSPLLRVSIQTGLRLGELLGLPWADIALDAGTLDVNRQWTRYGEFTAPKSPAAYRRLVLSDDLVAFLRQHKKQALASGKAHPLVFPSRTGTPLSHRNVQRRGFAPAAKLAEIEGVTVHSMRHAFASRMIHRGTSSMRLAQLMGHESSTITERRYVHIFNAVRSDEDVRAAMSM
jgi:integrase